MGNAVVTVVVKEKEMRRERPENRQQEERREHQERQEQEFYRKRYQRILERKQLSLRVRQRQDQLLQQR